MPPTGLWSDVSTSAAMKYRTQRGLMWSGRLECHRMRSHQAGSLRDLYDIDASLSTCGEGNEITLPLGPILNRQCSDAKWDD